MQGRKNKLNLSFQSPASPISKGNKNFLRAFYKKQLSTLSPSLKEQKQKQIVHLLAELPFWKEAKFIAAYRALKDEPCLSSFYSLWKDKICFPVIQNEILEFYTNPKDQWNENKWGVLEPKVQSENHIPLNDISIFLVPGQVFDRRGGRLGRGKAYYDKTLAGRNKHLGKTEQFFKTGGRTKTLYIGVSFMEQIHKEPLLLLEHDVLMDVLVTDSFVLMPLNQKDRAQKFFEKQDEKRG